MPFAGSNAYSDWLDPLVVLGQATSSNPSGNLIASAPVTGLYRITAYAVSQTAPATGTLTLSVGWTDTKQAQTANLGSVNLATAGNFLVGDVTVYAVAGQPITYGSVISGLTGSGTYDFIFLVELLA